MKTSYTFDVIDGYGRLTFEETNALWARIFVDEEHISDDEALAIGYVQMPAVFAQSDKYLTSLVVHEIPAAAGVPYRFIVLIDLGSDEAPDVFIPDELALLEFLARYGAFLTQPLGQDARLDISHRETRKRKRARQEALEAAERAGQRVTRERHL